MAAPVNAIPGLVSISFWERTGGTGPTESVFAVDGPELTVRLADPLGFGNNDISGATSEFYDVYYSDEDGSFNLNGEYLSIEGVYLQPLPAGGGLNLAEIGLNFDGEATEFGNFVASFVALGDNAFPSIVERAIDGDLLTHTSMGNTFESDQRLRVTLGFESSSGPVIPIPAAAWLFASALGVLGWVRRRTHPPHRDYGLQVSEYF
jgi:hypothetical protein